MADVKDGAVSHSPLPWTADLDRIDVVYVMSGDAVIALLADDEFERGDAELICRAVNSHAALVEALAGLHDDIAEYARINNLGGLDNHWMKAARAALALAGGK